MKKFDIVSKAYLWVRISVILMVISGFIFFSHMRLSIEFTGGIELKVDQQNIDNNVLKNDLTNLLKENSYKDFDVLLGKKDGYLDILFKMSIDNDEKVNKLSDLVKNFLIQKNYIDSPDKILEVSIIGPSIGEYMKKTTSKAMVIGIIFMGIYILFAFMSLKDMLSPMLLAGVTVFTLIHDVIIPLGAYGLVMMFNDTVQVDIIFVIALLTIVGYSINDTIIIFDRIRENLNKNEGAIHKGKMSYKQLFEDSLWQTMRRSFLTVFATLLVVIAMYVFGTGVLKNFAFTLMIGITAGSYSSIFVAAPLVYLLGLKNKDKRK